MGDQLRRFRGTVSLGIARPLMRLSGHSSTRGPRFDRGYSHATPPPSASSPCGSPAANGGPYVRRHQLEVIANAHEVRLIEEAVKDDAT